MKNKLLLSERNLITLINKIVLEQTPSYVPQDDMNSTNYLIQRDAEQENLKQQTSQTKAVPQQILKYCPNGHYQKVIEGPYFMCSQSNNIKPIQKQLKLTPDGKFGIDTLNAVYKMFGTTSLTDNMIKDFNSKVDDYETVYDSKNVSNTTYTRVSNLTNFNKTNIKISKNPYTVKKIYASYNKTWENGEFPIYINVTQPGSLESKKYTFVTNCSLLKSNIIQPPESATKYSFDESKVSNTIKNHFCKK